MFCITIAVVISVVAYFVIDLVLRSLKVGKVTDKYVFITGCDSGFGHLAAIRLDKLGFHVFAGCLTKDGAKTLSETCSSRLTPVDLDVRSTESIEQAVQVVQRKLPPDTGLWALLNNAGILGLYAPAEFCSRQIIQTALDVNLLGVIDVTRQFLPLIRKSKGRIVITTSSAGRLAFFPTPYTVSKFGAEAFADVLRREVSSQGINVSAVEPGAFRTSIMNTDKIVGDLQTACNSISSEVKATYDITGYVEKTRKTFSNLNACQDIGFVVDAYIHAITSKFPRTRYVVGTDAKLIFIPLTYLPDRIADFILAKCA